MDTLKMLDKFDELLEPETVRQLFPVMDDLEFEKLMALLTVKFSNTPFENFYVFENVIRAINGVIPDITIVEGAPPKWICYGVQVMRKVRPEQEFSHEVVQYIKRIFADNGIFIYNPELETENPIYDNIVSIVQDDDNYPIEDKDFISRQSIHFLTLKLYTKINQDG